MTRLMLDTNIFNWLLENPRLAERLSEFLLVGTFVQEREIRSTRCDQKRNELLRIFTYFISQTERPYTTFWGDPWNSRWSDDDSLFQKMKERLETLDRASGKKNKNPLNQRNDVQIAETAIKADLTMLTGDSNLAILTREFGGIVICVTKDNFMLELEGCG
jgi:hypothetical protein